MSAVLDKAAATSVVDTGVHHLKLAECKTLIGKKQLAIGAQSVTQIHFDDDVAEASRDQQRDSLKENSMFISRFYLVCCHGICTYIYMLTLYHNTCIAYLRSTSYSPALSCVESSSWKWLVEVGEREGEKEMKGFELPTP